MLSSRKRRVKIVCTLGPKSCDAPKIRSLIRSGMNVARLNFSHGEHSFHQGLIQSIRQSAAEEKKSVAIMQDLQGPKIRLGKLPQAGVALRDGDVVWLSGEGAKNDATSLPVSAELAEAIFSSIQVGARILFDDGKLASVVKKVESRRVQIQFENGGVLTSHKGMNLPGTPLKLSCITEKDKIDLEFGLAHRVDAVALSFVRSASDILELKEIIKSKSSEMPLIIAKIEREEALANIDEILSEVDGLLIARGDMAVKLGPEFVPSVQKRLILACNSAGVPVITATQMLESMINSPTPTRAEASDVANAVFDGTDAVMLSAETASGQYPDITVQTMSRIVMQAEQFMLEGFHRVQATEDSNANVSIVDSIEQGAARIADQVDAVAIACITHSGTAARTLAKFRPNCPIVAILDNERVLRRLDFIWGVNGILIPKILGTDDLFAMVESVILANAWGKENELIVVTAGTPTLKRGTTNTIKVHRLGVQNSRWHDRNP